MEGSHCFPLWHGWQYTVLALLHELFMYVPVYTPFYMNFHVCAPWVNLAMHTPYFQLAAHSLSNGGRDDSVSGMGCFSAAACSDMTDSVFAETPMDGWIDLGASGRQQQDLALPVFQRRKEVLSLKVVISLAVEVTWCRLIGSQLGLSMVCWSARLLEK